MPYVGRRKPLPSTNRRQKAVALGYNAERDEAPKVLATGQGKLAEQIISAAQESAIPIREDPALVNALAAVDLDASIPPELYTVVAEVLAWVYRVHGNTRILVEKK